MQSPSPLPPVQQFILDCAELASSLDSLDTHDHYSDVVAGVLNAQTQLDALLLRRHALSSSSDEEVWVEFMVDCLRARLRFLGGRVGMAATCVRKALMPQMPQRISC